MNHDIGTRQSHTRDNGLLDRLVERSARKIIDRLAEDVSPDTWQRIIDYAGERFGRRSIGQGGRGWPAVSTPASTADAQATPGADRASVRESAATSAESTATGGTAAPRRKPARRPARAARTAPDTTAVNGTEPASAAESNGGVATGSLDLLNVHEFAELIGIGSAQTVRNRLRQGRLIGWKNERGAFVLPAGQINQHKKPLRGLAEVITVFGNGQAAWNWLTTATLENGRTPLEELQAGRFRVVEHAAHAAAPETETPA